MTDGQSVADGRYRLEAPLGRGGMAEVHRGVDVRLGRLVAVKLLGGHLAADSAAQARFRREAQAAASLNHPSIASVYDTGEDTDPSTGISIPYIVMELVEGPTLRSVLDDVGPLPPRRALEITRSVLAALGHSHGAGIIHRDIKPANVMLTPADDVKVMDFGIARVIDDTSSLTQTAAVIGTAQYLSPEQASGKQVDLRSDLYSVGCLLFELLVGRPPFVGESSVAVAYQHVREDPVAPSQLNPAISAEIDAVVLKALAKNPDERYQSAQEMADDLDRLLTGAAPGAPVPVPPALQTTALAQTAVASPTQTMPLAAAAVPASLAAEPPTVIPPPTPPAALAEEPPKSSAGRTILVTISVVLLLGLGAFALYRALAPDGQGAGPVVVPAVIGSTRADAEAELRGAGLVPEFKNVRGESDDTVGRVIKQKPVGTTEVEAGSVVTVEINVGPASVKIPDDLVGENVEDVEKELAAAGFTNVQTRPVDDPPGDAKRGEVLSIDPDEGESAALDEDVVVRYAAEADATKSAKPTSEPSETDEPEPTKSPEPTETEDEETEKPTKTAKPSPTPAETTATKKATKTPEPDPSDGSPSGEGETPNAPEE